MVFWLQGGETVKESNVPMTGNEIKIELLKRNMNILQFHQLLLNQVSYDTTSGTIKGSKNNPIVLKKLEEIGIKHNRKFREPRKPKVAA